MSNWKLVKLNFGRNPVHFGRLGIGIEETTERVHSDSLFSAWISSYARLFGKNKVEELLQNFPKYLNQTSSQVEEKDSTPLKISSTFIYRQIEDKTVYYLPRPIKSPINYPKDDLKFLKTYKKIKYLPLEIWQRWYQGKGFSDQDGEELKERVTNKEAEGELKTAGTFDYSKAFKINKHPKIAVDRITAATNLYHTGLVQFQWEKETSGLYFLLNYSYENKQLEKELKAALNLLGEEGIGGERSSGAGRFTAEWLELPETWNKIVKASGTHHTLISLFWDSSITEEFLQNAAYEIQECGGWIAQSNIRRRKVRMFAEGSVFAQKPQGELVDVTPAELIDNAGKPKFHPIYRSGISLALPIKIKPPFP